jgi:hypothetical protein
MIQKWNKSERKGTLNTENLEETEIQAFHQIKKRSTFLDERIKLLENKVKQLQSREARREQVIA